MNARDVLQLAQPPRFTVTERTRLLCLVAVLGGLTLIALVSLMVGTRDVPPADVLAAITGDISTLDRAAVATRIPRTVLALIAGASLGLAGAVMQGVTRNPLADPGILGINTGASLAVVVGVAWFGISSAHSFIWLAIFGAAATSIFVYTIGSMGRGGATPLKLALAGTATAIAFSSLVIAIVLPRADIAGGIRSWQIGGVGGATFERMEPVYGFLIIGFALCMLSARKLNVLALGDELAAGLGENVAVARIIATVGAVILCGATTAVCGPISFVGLVVPHVCRLLFGVDYRWLLPFSALGGAILLTLSDIVGRFAARPSELEVGVVTALVGAPFFIFIVRRQKVKKL
ncbi:FecCD family ABC transporter permease [Agrobacterium larrymoorei]|uniref:Iron complex transport system permease protein n=1 Tax=Agrobacterium larrymoorei TaxID=160699 RepID=A0ABU0UHR3_9HYPH|nr:iron ABC transporter permease [Agrobacterium larrymoorei]MDQ1184483.1 iron complex transport system permease protein [Agrobacterium larrymoorei]